MSRKRRSRVHPDWKALADRIQVIHRIETGGAGEDDSHVTSTAFSPDGRYLATATRLGSVKLWDLVTGTEVTRFYPDEDVGARAHTVTFSPDGMWLGVGGSYAGLWNWPTGDRLRTLPEAARLVYSFTFSHDSVWAAAIVGIPEQVLVWDVTSGTVVSSLRAEGANCIAFAPHTRGLIVPRLGGLSWYDPVSGRDTRLFETSPEPHPIHLAFRPDGERLAVTWPRLQSHPNVRVFDVRTGSVIWGQRLNDAINSAVWSPDGRILASRCSSTVGLKLWDARSRSCIYERVQANDDYIVTKVLSFSPDGRHLVACAPNSTSTVEILDITPLTTQLGVERPPTTSSPSLLAASEIMRRHLMTCTLCHTTGPTPARPAYWLRAAATVGAFMPLWLAQDLGNVLTQAGIAVRRPAYLPEDIDTGPYAAFLSRIARSPLSREISGWAMSDSMIGVVLARLLQGVVFPADYQFQHATVDVARELAGALAHADTARLWKHGDPADRPVWHQLLPSAGLARIESNLRRLGIDELRFLHRYGPRFAGAPAPRDLLDLFSLLELPSPARQSLSQVLRLLPSVSQSVSGGEQTHAIGGYEGLTRIGGLDSLVPTELAYPRDLFVYRVMNREALYYGREGGQEPRRELVYIVTQIGIELAGDADLLARTLTLAIAQTMLRRGYEVQQSFVGQNWTPPEGMNRPRDVQRLLHHRDEGTVNPRDALEAVSRQIKAWGERYRRIQVFWVLGDHWDADDRPQHLPLYRRLRQQAPQHVWFIRINGNHTTSRPEPVTFHEFQHAHVVDSRILWPA